MGAFFLVFLLHIRVGLSVNIGCDFLQSLQSQVFRRKLIPTFLNCKDVVHWSRKRLSSIINVSTVPRLKFNRKLLSQNRGIKKAYTGIFFIKIRGNDLPHPSRVKERMPYHCPYMNASSASCNLSRMAEYLIQDQGHSLKLVEY